MVYDYLIRDHELEQVNLIRDLGVYFEKSHLNFECT